MSSYDVFNGDADGLCALQQLRLSYPADARLITGAKRDIQLLGRVYPDPGDSVTVLDLSLDRNRSDLDRILSAGADVAYFDHHFSGPVPAHDRLTTHLSTAEDVCTSLLVDEFVHGKHRPWAIVGAFGDNLDGRARVLGSAALADHQVEQLREMGQLLNYNSYGRTVADLHFAPDHLFGLMRRYPNPFDFLAGESLIQRLREGYDADMARLPALEPEIETGRSVVYVLPDEAWSRRICGVMANDLVRRHPANAYAVVVPNMPNCYMVSIRVSAKGSPRADEFCRQFDSGGGRATAGGINHLPERRLDDFLELFQRSYG
jgi:hypothetical protein